MSDNKAMNEWIRNRGRAPVAATKKPPAPAFTCGTNGMRGDNAQVAFDSDCFSKVTVSTRRNAPLCT